MCITRHKVIHKFISFLPKIRLHESDVYETGKVHPNAYLFIAYISNGIVTGRACNRFNWIEFMLNSMNWSGRFVIDSPPNNENQYNNSSSNKQRQRQPKNHLVSKWPKCART